MKIYNKVKAILGESPVWHPKHQCLFWVDIIGKKIFRLSSDFGQHQVWDMPDQVGCIVPTNDGHLLAALSDSIVHVSTDTGQVKELPLGNSLSSNEMFNDGKVDALGRFWVATKDINEASPIGRLYCYSNNILIEKDDGFTVGNGIDWSLDNQTMLVTDSPSKKIYRYHFDLNNGDINDKTVFATSHKGYPDGLTINSQGHVFSAHWDGSCVSHYDSSGDRLETMAVDALRPTSCCFGGPSLRTLFITSASYQCDEDDKSNGCLFYKDVLVAGREAFCYQL